ncbi:hypothetical protein Bbelb_081880 [Branchiostoma belcheri]|nr:hypothetical protein Bbelb_081880 [Branchiostoma belcheri]
MAELGRYPLRLEASLNAIKHFIRIRQNVPADSLSADALLCQLELDTSGAKCWASGVRKTLEECDSFLESSEFDIPGAAPFARTPRAGVGTTGSMPPDHPRNVTPTVLAGPSSSGKNPRFKIPEESQLSFRPAHVHYKALLRPAALLITVSHASSPTFTSSLSLTNEPGYGRLIPVI